MAHNNDVKQGQNYRCFFNKTFQTSLFEQKVWYYSYNLFGTLNTENGKGKLLHNRSWKRGVSCEREVAPWALSSSSPGEAHGGVGCPPVAHGHISTWGHGGAPDVAAGHSLLWPREVHLQVGWQIRFTVLFRPHAVSSPFSLFRDGKESSHS